jgi:hypothetical protein
LIGSEEKGKKKKENEKIRTGENSEKFLEHVKLC